jgi:hypothetical protein
MGNTTWRGRDSAIPWTRVATSLDFARESDLQGSVERRTRCKDASDGHRGARTLRPQPPGGGVSPPGWMATPFMPLASRLPGARLVDSGIAVMTPPPPSRRRCTQWPVFPETFLSTLRRLRVATHKYAGIAKLRKEPNAASLADYTSREKTTRYVTPVIRPRPARIRFLYWKPRKPRSRFQIYTSSGGSQPVTASPSAIVHFQTARGDLRAENSLLATC